MMTGHFNTALLGPPLSSLNYLSSDGNNGDFSSRSNYPPSFDVVDEGEVFQNTAAAAAAAAISPFIF